MSDPAKTDEPDTWMSRAEYQRWAEGRRGRFERVDGRVAAMAPERVGRTRIKGQVFRILCGAIEAAGLPCEVLTDGPTIEVDESDYEPDAIVRCGDVVIPDDSLAVPDPLIVVEVLSPRTRRTDVGLKLADYFRIATVQHYIILFADRIQAVHHRRAGDRIETRVMTHGDLVLDPPGLTVPLASLYPPR